MEVYSNDDNTVVKYLHDDGSETCIKTTPSTTFATNASGEITETSTDKNKYSIIISSSVGCKVGCKFCYLTTKKCEYHKLGIMDVVNNVMMALDHKAQFDPSIKDKYAKLCFMGMGEALFDITSTTNIALAVINLIIHNGYAAGFDGIDIGTVGPSNIDKDELVERLDFLNNFGDLLTKNPANKDRSFVRLFYSLHMINPYVRKRYIPRAEMASKFLGTLYKIHRENIDVIVHQMFLDGIEDNDVDAYIDIYNLYFKRFELRVLRFNECPNTEFKESKKFVDIINKLSDNIDRLKLQVSPGDEISAACGQFIVKNYIKRGGE